MEKYNSKQSDFQIEAGNTAILGFQQVLSNPEKVFMWVRGNVSRPKHSDRHKTIKMANNSYQRVEWAKSVWLIEKVLEHFGKQLNILGISEKHFDSLSDDEKCDKWETIGDGDRNFLKAVVMNPVSEVTGEHLVIQVTQHEGSTPKSLLERAYTEAFGDDKKYQKLLAKFQDRALVRTYTDTVIYHDGFAKPTKKLVEVYTIDDKGVKYPIYETNEVTLGEPNHIFLKYKIPNLIPKETLDEINRRAKLLNPQAVNMIIDFPEEEKEKKKEYSIMEEKLLNK